MKNIFSKYLDQLYFKHWIIGLCRDNIKDIIRTKTFDQNIKWLSLNSIDHYNADPFIFRTDDGKFNILFEDYTLEDLYGKILLMALDDNLNPVSQKIILDTKSHLSYPFIYRENNKIYVFPESSHSGRLSCYEYDPVDQSLIFLKEILNLPLLDSTILKKDNKYWLFGTLNGKDSHNKLYIYYSDSLFGPYLSHPKNPVKNSLNDSRPAGNFIEVDGILYRPSQNCRKFYGESLVINKVIILDEFNFEEESYMTVVVDEKNMTDHHIHTIHTINVLDDVIAVDGKKWTFSPVNQWKFFLTNRRLSKIQRANKNSSFTSTDK